MFTETWESEIGRYSPARRAPVLLHGDLAVWDTTAIFQHVCEHHAQAVSWPVAQPARAHAQSISAEMHSGFLAIRDELPQNIRVRHPRALSELSDSCLRQIRRIEQIWSGCRKEYGSKGDWLFGDISLADIMFTPVALRFLSYQIPVSEAAAEFQHAVVAHPYVREWIAAATAEPEVIPFIDDLVPAVNSPLTLG